MRVASLIALKNDIQRDGGRYTGNIGDNVIKILTKDLGLSENMIEIDKPTNSCSFYGVFKKPLDVLVMLAKQSIPSKLLNAFKKVS